MNGTNLIIGIDRFLAKRWADYALDIYLSGCSMEEAYEQLKSWIAIEIQAKEVAEKTSSQLRRLWLNNNDPYAHLRRMVVLEKLSDDTTSRSILHYGMALNVFPFFRELCIVAGRLLQVQGSFQRKEIQQRLREKFGNPETVSRATSRCLHTIEDWGILEQKDDSFTGRALSIVDQRIAEWLICSLLLPLPDRRGIITDLAHAPEKMGIKLHDERSVFRSSEHLSLIRNGLSEEVVVFSSPTEF